MPQRTGADLVAKTFTANGTLDAGGRFRISKMFINGTGTLTISGTRSGSAKTWLAQPFVTTNTLDVPIPSAGLIIDPDPSTTVAGEYTTVTVNIGALTNVTIFWGG
jgi:hypothetical protein